METSSAETESPLSLSNPNTTTTTTTTKKKMKAPSHRRLERSSSSSAWPRKTNKRGGSVTLEGYVQAKEGEVGSGGGVGRTKSLSDGDLEELKGCLDLGFGFSYEEIPELCNTLPALELCYSMSQRYLDEKPHNSLTEEPETPVSRSPIANWKISSPGDDPDEVKARLKYWAQAVACTVRLCK